MVVASLFDRFLDGVENPVAVDRINFISKRLECPRKHSGFVAVDSLEPRRPKDLATAYDVFPGTHAPGFESQLEALFRPFCRNARGSFHFIQARSLDRKSNSFSDQRQQMQVVICKLAMSDGTDVNHSLQLFRNSERRARQRLNVLAQKWTGDFYLREIVDN